MKKEANFDEVLFSLGQEVIQVLKMHKMQCRKRIQRFFQYYLKLHQKIYARGFSE